MKEIRKLVEGFHLQDIDMIQQALKTLLEMAETDKDIEDYLIIIIYEATVNGKLETCSKTAAIVSGLILEANPHRDMLTAIADGINDPTVNEDPNRLDNVVFEETDLPVDKRRAFWNKIDRVKEVKKLFAQAPYSSAVDERCAFTPANTEPSIDDLLDHPEPTPTQHRPDSVPSDWKKDDTCVTDDSVDTDPTDNPSQAESSTDKWPEDDAGNYFVDGDYVDYF